MPTTQQAPGSARVTYATLRELTTEFLVDTHSSSYRQTLQPSALTMSARRISRLDSTHCPNLRRQENVGKSAETSSHAAPPMCLL